MCPSGLHFSAVELEEIRLERLDDVERGIRRDMRVLADKLQFHRQRHQQDFRTPASGFEGEGEGDALLGLGDFNIDGSAHSPQARINTTNSRIKDETPLAISLGKQTPIKSKTIEDEKVDDDDADMWQVWNKMHNGSTPNLKKKEQKVENDADEEKIYAYKSFKFENRHVGRDNPRDRPPIEGVKANSQKPQLQTPPQTPAKVNTIMASSPAPNKPPLPSRPPPLAVKIGASDARSSSENYSIDVSMNNHKLRELHSEPTGDQLIARRTPPIHKNTNSLKIDGEGSSIVPITTGNRPPPPRGPPPGFRSPPTRSPGSGKKD